MTQDTLYTFTKINTVSRITKISKNSRQMSHS